MHVRNHLILASRFGDLAIQRFRGFGVRGLEVEFTVSGFERLKVLGFSSLGFGGLAV